MPRFLAVAALAAATAAALRHPTMLASIRAALAAPVINDVATDVDDAPTFAEGRVPPLPESFIPSIKAAYPDLAPLPLSITPAAAFDAVKAAAAAMTGWEVVRADAAGLLLEAVATTPLLRFMDDVVVRVRPAPKGPGAVVDVRSRSRLGKGDLGANAARIRVVLKKVKAAAEAV